MSEKNEKHKIDRRAFLHKGAAALAGLGLGGAGLSLVGCENGPAKPAGSAAARAQATSGGGPARAMTLTAGPLETEVGPGRLWRTWGYNGQYPGPEIRVKEGERLRVTVENKLPDAGTTVHWHGVPVPNAMDGVPSLTQEPILVGEAFVYEYEAAPAGTYMYHSHQNLQLDRGLVGPLIIEERTPHVDYDREHTVILDDFLPGEPRTLEELAAARGGEGGRQRSGGMMGGMMNRGESEESSQQGGMMGGEGCPMMSDGGGGQMMGGIVPPYEGLMINGNLPEDPAVFDVKKGERVRFRLVNLSSATTYHLALAGHRMRVSHTEGRPVEPVEVDSLLIGMGERYDVIVEATRPGAHTLLARPVAGDAPPARAVVRYTGSRQNRPPEGEVPAGLRGGRRLRYADLQSVETPLGGGSNNGSEPDRTFDLRLSGGMMMSRGEWAIGGQQYPDADPLQVKKGERVRVNLSNMSMMLHPMHLHGHFFRVGNAIKDTVLIEPRMGRVSFDFVADNPGDWFFHCHNLYHLHAGMAREFRYV